MRMITLRTDDATITKLDLLACQTGRTRSAILRRLIAQAELTGNLDLQLVGQAKVSPADAEMGGAEHD